MTTRGLIAGQKVNPAKVEEAKALRRHMTAEERLLWKALRGKRLQQLHSRRQQVIDGYIVDFYCHAHGLVVEVDGPVHEQTAEYDAVRDEALGHRGIRVLRINNAAVREDLAAVLKRIAQACERA